MKNHPTLQSSSGLPVSVLDAADSWGARPGAFPGGGSCRDRAERLAELHPAPGVVLPALVTPVPSHTPNRRHKDPTHHQAPSTLGGWFTRTKATQAPCLAATRNRDTAAL